MNPSLEFYVSLHGILKTGAVVSLLPLFGTEAIEFRAKKSNAKMVIINESGKALVKSGLVQRIVTAEELMGLIEKEDEHYEPHTSPDTLAFMAISVAPRHAESSSVPPSERRCIVGFAVKFVVTCGILIVTSALLSGLGPWDLVRSVGPLIFGNAIGALLGRFSAETLGRAESSKSRICMRPFNLPPHHETGHLTGRRLSFGV
jgi:hypothetical protein